MFLAYKTEMWKEIWRLDQKDVVEFMELKVSSNIEDWLALKSGRGETDKSNISLWSAVCRLNHVVGERSPSTAL